MNARVLAIALACALATAGVLYVLVSRSSRPADVPAASTAPAAPATSSATAPADAGRGPDVARPEPRSAPRAAAEAEPAAPADAAASTLGTLRIDSDVPGAQVFLDRQLVGKAPVTVSNVSPGTHQINVSAEGFEGVAEKVEVMPGPRDVMIRLREVRLDLSLAVVHKHRVGSCKGQLMATPQGVRYDTSDKDDAFSVALGDLERLEVEYLQKNLRLKVRGGKQYDFTDPDGNADRLFVFHRDVTKARDRLAKGDTPAP